MRIGEVMTKDVWSIGPSAPAGDALRLMRDENVRHLVVMEGNRILGVVSDRDVAAADAAGRLVSDVMTPHPVTTTRHATVREVANLLRGHVIGCVPVVDGGRLVGIVTTTDVLDLIGRGAERPVEQAKRWTLKHRGPRGQKRRRAK